MNEVSRLPSAGVAKATPLPKYKDMSDIACNVGHKGYGATLRYDPLSGGRTEAEAAGSASEAK